MTIRVAYLCGEYPRATDTFIQREVAGLRSAGVHVETISVRAPAVSERGTEEQRAERERTHYLLPCSPWRLFRDHAGLFAAAPGRYFRALRLAGSVRSPGARSLMYQAFYFAEAGMLAARLKSQCLSHVHNHAPDAAGYVTMLGAALAGCTYSMTLHGFGILSEPTRWRLKDKLERSLFTIAVSQSARSQAMLWSDVSCWDRYHVVHCGVDPRKYVPRRHEGRGRRLLFVGRLDRVKGIPVLLDAVAALREAHPDVRLDLAGDGPERGALEALVRDMGLSQCVSFLGYQSSEQLSSLRAETDVAVMSSFAEGVPVVLMEALAAGIPVVAPRIAGIPELVEEQVSGVLVPPGDAQALAQGIDRLLRDPALRTTMGAAGRMKVETEFNIAAEVKRLIEIFQSRLEVAPASVTQGEESSPMRCRNAAAGAPPAGASI